MNARLREWINTSSVLSMPRRSAWHMITWALAQRGMTAVPTTTSSYRAEDYLTIQRVARETDMRLLQDEAYQLLSCARGTAKVLGEMAEVGVFRGGSARLMCEVSAGRQIYLFDTFEGLPANEEAIPGFEQGQYAGSYEAVTQYLRSFHNVHIYKGEFPDGCTPITSERFSFVHLDVDLSEPTQAALEFFYPRLNSGGVFLIHDYFWSENIRKVVQEFFVRLPEPVLELAGAYCGVVKV